jgi:hypothetical protein
MEALPSLKTKPSRLSWLIKEKGKSSQDLVPRLDQEPQPPTTKRLPKDLRSPKSTVKSPLNQPNEREAQLLGSDQVAPPLDGVLSKQKQAQLPKTKPELLLSSVSEEDKLPPRAPSMNQEGPPPDTKSLKQQLQLCLTHFKDLIATSLESLKISVYAKPHFSAIVTWLGDLLSRLEAWTHDSGINDPTISGKELDARLKGRIAALFRNIMTRLERVRKDVEVMRIAAEQMSGSGMIDRLVHIAVLFRSASVQTEFLSFCQQGTRLPTSKGRTRDRKREQSHLYHRT